jgi:hypothetical protein
VNDTTETATEGREVAVVAAPRPPKTPLVAGSKPLAIVPTDFDGAYRIANVVCQAGMAPKSLQSVEKAMVAILHGLEVGLTPMNALQSIAVINGKPTIYGDGAVGLIRASGLLEYMKEFFENEDKENMKAVCIVKRKGEPEPVKTDFSMADAKKAGLLGKDGPWQTYPKRMLRMRARWGLRDTFADVLKGLSLREEVEDMERADPAAQIAAPVRRAPPPPAIESAVEQRAEAAAATATKAATEEAKQEAVKEPTKEPERKKDDPISSGLQKTDAGFPGDTPMKSDAFDVEVWLQSLDNAFSSCEDTSTLIEQQGKHMTPRKPIVSAEDWKRAVAIIRSHLSRVQTYE